IFALLRTQSDIAYDYIDDGCYARAHLMIQRMLALNLDPYRVWAFANGQLLYVKTDKHPEGVVQWTWHCAPALWAEDADGKLTTHVIDPSLCDGRVTDAEWAARLKRPGSSIDPYVTITLRGQAPKGPDIRDRRIASERVPVVQYPGTGYWPGNDPAEGVDAH